MQTISSSKLILLGLTMAGLSLGGCGLVSVDMTSTPATAKRGDPVTFDIKLTNQSQCPLATSAAVLIPFISPIEFEALFNSVPADAPPEILAFLQELRAFFDELCSGGTPTLPMPPPFATGPAVTSGTPRERISARCHLNGNEVECLITGRVSGEANGMTFSLLGDRMDCSVDDGTVRCLFHISLTQDSTPAATTSAAISPLTCLTPAQLGIPDDQEFGAICFLGSFPMFSGLGPLQMAEGQVTLPARGSGLTRNLVIAISPDAEDAGVCKGGASAGQACDRSDFMPCPSSSCGEGICVGGDTPGVGCDVATQATDCPNGGMCKVCSDPAQPSFLPIDCTTTYVSPEPAPAMSVWGLVTMAALLLVIGTVWLDRRRARLEILS